MPAGMWIVVAAEVLVMLVSWVLIPLVDWWYDPNRRPARFHRDTCTCCNCNDYVGVRDAQRP